MAAYDQGKLAQVPADDAARRVWLRTWMDERSSAERFRAQLIHRYGEAHGAGVQHAEAFIACPYGARLTPEAKARLWPL